MTRAIVIGAGIGGLSAAIELAAKQVPVHVVESHHEAGGKAASILVDGVRADTGPSILTLPNVFDDLFQKAGSSLADHIELVRPSPAFRYRWNDGAVFEVHHELDRTVEEAGRVFGEVAKEELVSFMAYARSIWDIAAPPFLFGERPTWASLLTGPFQIDPLRSMQRAIHAKVKEPHLRDVLARYATYNGSDPRRAPATLNCIAHVELALGGYGVNGGIRALVEALVGVALELGVTFQFGAPVERILVDDGHTVGVRLPGGERLEGFVICNADVAQVATDLLPSCGVRTPKHPSTSAHNALLRVPRACGLAAHEVRFPDRYLAEFEDLFDHKRIPTDPTVYLCNQREAHGVPDWGDDDVVFAMINAPAGSLDGPEEARASFLAAVPGTLLWERTPADLTARFPHTGGALYGSSSNSSIDALLRPGTRVRGARGLYLASGSGHPGGGLPLAALAGGFAARAALADQGA